MKVIAKGNFWSNGIEGFPGKVLTNEEQDIIGDLLVDLVRNKLVQFEDEDPFVAVDDPFPENLGSLEKPELDEPVKAEEISPSVEQPLAPQHEEPGLQEQPQAEISPEPKKKKK
jgi:hypothetical protein